MHAVGYSKFTAQDWVMAVCLLVASINFFSAIGVPTLHAVSVFFVLFLFLAFLLLGGSVLRIERSFVMLSFVLLALLFTNIARAGYLSLLPSLNFLFNLYVVPVFAYFIGRSCYSERSLFVFRVTFIFIVTLSFIVYLFQWSGESDFSGTQASGSVYGGVVSLYALLFFIFFQRGKLKLDLMLSAAALLLLVMSKHRAGLLAIVISLWIYIGLRGSRSSMGSIIWLAVIGAFALVGLFALFVLSPEFFVNQFYDGDIALENINTSGRAAIWGMLTDEWSKSAWLLLFGGGIGHSTMLITENFPSTLDSIAVPHNEWLRLGVDMGLLGILIYALFINRFVSAGVAIAGNPVVVALIAHVYVEMFFSNAIFWSGSYFAILGISCAVLSGGRESVKNNLKIKL